MKKDSSPGYPYVVLAKDNRGILDNGYGNFIWKTVCDQFNRALALGEEVFNLNAEQLLRHGICDPVKVFIKDEPHKLKKIESGKLRLISSVSLVDQIKTRLLCNMQNTKEINNWETCPSKPGLGLHDEGLSVIAETARRFLKEGPVAETDVSGWDWSVQHWELMLDAEARIRLAGANPNGVFAFLLRVHAHCVSNSVFVTPDGNMWAQTVPGGQLSGDYNTSSTNSRMRVMASLASRLWAGQPLLVNGRIPVAAMGDDSFELDFAGLKEGMNAIGHTVRFVESRNSLQGLHFCSQEFTAEGVAYPEDPSKTVFRFLGHKPTHSTYLELRAQLLWYLRHLVGSDREIIEKLTHARVDRANKLNGNSKTTSCS